ncbi:MAG: hypothetical protein QM765_03795 [Myxococcales bacterium]
MRTKKAGRFVGKWEGGKVWEDSDGRLVYHIFRMIHGVHYRMSTRATTLEGALTELRRFETNPSAYVPGGEALEPLHLTETLAQEFMDWSRDVKKNSETWRYDQARYLKWWGEKLDGLDLRRVDLGRDVMPALKDANSKPQRIAVLKRLYSWLRLEKHVIAPTEDPTFGQLTVPQATPEQRRHSKVIPEEHYMTVRERLKDPHWRDGLNILRGTGWHVTELERFARNGLIESYQGTDSEVAAVLVVEHKSGKEHRTAVSELVLHAARRIRARGTFCRRKFAEAIARACDGADPVKEPPIDVFTPGRFRHTVATNAINAGADSKAVVPSDN